MSQKITAKNLQYSSNLPPFLARLRGEAQHDSDRPDPILAARRRPVKPRSGSAEAEDAPTIVDEHGNVVDDVTLGRDGSVKEREGPSTSTTTNDKEEGEDIKVDGVKTASAAEKVASIGLGKKRKVGKVIGGEADEEQGTSDAAAGAARSTDAKHQKDEGVAKSKPKKKAKKIKLSFGDDEG
ncbi:hypothetical protein QBC42DRAFT_345103 [Cladorrhinum samala]|uniref:DUF4604 domain-containing protein n=1 Tax=Cladorrhinum samala TaxID=585594 RepID=A0AAV9HWJ5_9PEZI|nr:hypothetical protein QBC42DRAFT_345103 [Cladorrhinum samala]